jgi:hypothetical protein
MEIRIVGKLEPNNTTLYSPNEIEQISWIGEGFVFIDYLDEDIFLSDVFILEDGIEITLREIKIQFDTKEPWTMMDRGLKCLCRFEGFDLNKVPVVKDWFSNTSKIVARRKT